MSAKFPLLEQINDVQSLRLLDRRQLDLLAVELRDFLIQTVGKTGGHLSSSLGVVELTIALHYVFNTPDDHLVWDVGHQSYPHKILTGRREQMKTIRQKNGLSGFTKRSESQFDDFGAGHASTSVSAALGMALANQYLGKKNHSIAVIGDGALTGGMSFEALNHAGEQNANLIVILNDNKMSISENVGGLSRYLGRAISGPSYSYMRESSRKVLSKLPGAWSAARRLEEHFKGMMVPGTLFEELGFNYLGPIDGHDIDALLRSLGTLQSLEGSHFLHVVTRKGKGFEPAEQDPCGYHGVAQYDPDNGEMIKIKKPQALTYTQVFGQWLCDMAKEDDQLMAITPAMSSGSGMCDFVKQFPSRYMDVGIAEQHAVTLAAGLATQGIKPVVAIYSTFLQRAYDQLIHDVALQKLSVLFAIDRAGVVGADGATHAGVFDLSFLRCVPEMLIMVPADENECRLMLSTGFHYDGPAAVRYPRDSGCGVEIDQALNTIEIGKAEIRRQGEKLAILCFGTLIDEAMIVAEKLNLTLINMRFVKPLDTALLDEIIKAYQGLVTIEENVIHGGAGSAVSEYMSVCQHFVPILHLGLPDAFVEHGSRQQIVSDCGLDSQGIEESINQFTTTLGMCMK